MGFWNKGENESDSKKNQSESAGQKTADKTAESGKGDAVPSATAQSAQTTKARSEGTPQPSQSASAGDIEARLAQRFGTLRAALGAGTVIQGKLSFDTPVRIDGKLSGEIHSTDAIIVGEEGVIDAEVEVKTLIVMGLVKGKITATNLIEILDKGKLQGDIVTPTLMVDEGAQFDGNCKMPGAGKRVEPGKKSDSTNDSSKDGKGKSTGAGGSVHMH